MKANAVLAGQISRISLLFSLICGSVFAVLPDPQVFLKSVFGTSHHKVHWSKHTAVSLEQFRTKLQIKSETADNLELILPSDATQHILNAMDDTLWIPAEKRKSALSLYPVTAYPGEWLMSDWMEGTKKEKSTNYMVPLAVASSFRLTISGSELANTGLVALIEETVEQEASYLVSGTAIRVDIGGVVFESVPSELIRVLRK